MSAPAFAAAPGRLDVVLAETLRIPRADAQRAIADGRVLVDGRARPKSHRLEGGERIEVDLAGFGDLLPEGPPVPVRHEDPHLAVVVKPTGVPTHPTAARRSGTLVNRLLGMGMPLSGSGDPLRPGIVHRLDAGTSGLLIVAKDESTAAALSAMLRRREVERRYLALVAGVPEHERFVVEAPLGRRGARIVVTGVGKEAATAFEVRERFSRAALLEATPRTGRTHQIRVHLSAVGHPILGDARYGGGGDRARALRLRRPFLHAWHLSFAHPVTGERIELKEPLPEDLRAALRRAAAEA